MGSIMFCNRSHPDESPPSRHTQLVSYKIANTATYKQNSSLNIDLYFPCRYLGKGIYGSTVEVFNKNKKDQRYAEKVLKADWIKEEFLFFNFGTLGELNNSAHFVHTKMIKCEGEKLYILMEKLETGDLYTFIRKKPKEIDLQVIIKKLAWNIILILEQIHAKNYIYRSLRPQNILFTNREGDFQLSELLFCVSAEQCPGFYGAATYTPPEVFAELGYDKSLDLWTMGVLIYEILVGETPFEGANLDQIKQNVLNLRSHEIKYPEGVEVSQDLQDLLNRLLEPDPSLRLSLKQTKGHPFFQDDWEQNQSKMSSQIIKANMQKQDNECPNRIVYRCIGEGKPMPKDFGELLLDIQS